MPPMNGALNGTNSSSRAARVTTSITAKILTVVRLACWGLGMVMVMVSVSSNARFCTTKLKLVFPPLDARFALPYADFNLLIKFRNLIWSRKERPA